MLDGTTVVRPILESALAEAWIASAADDPDFMHGALNEYAAAESERGDDAPHGSVSGAELGETAALRSRVAKLERLLQQQ